MITYFSKKVNFYRIFLFYVNILQNYVNEEAAKTIYRCIERNDTPVKVSFWGCRLPAGGFLI